MVFLHKYLIYFSLFLSIMSAAESKNIKSLTAGTARTAGELSFDLSKTPWRYHYLNHQKLGKYHFFTYQKNSQTEAGFNRNLDVKKSNESFINIIKKKCLKKVKSKKINITTECFKDYIVNKIDFKSKITYAYTFLSPAKDKKNFYWNTLSFRGSIPLKKEMKNLFDKVRTQLK